MSKPTPPPHYPYGDPDNGWTIEENDFYKHVDQAFGDWYATTNRTANLSTSMPYELTAREPVPRRVVWKNARSSLVTKLREWQLKVNPVVADEVERLEKIERPSKEEASRPFSPSPLACYRAGFSEGVQREKSRANDDWGYSLSLAEEDDRRTGWARGALKRTIEKSGADYARQLLEEVIAELEQAPKQEPPAAGGAFHA